jgi:hypothetical protein
MVAGTPSVLIQGVPATIVALKRQ